ncbi:uncharacterized protein H6S33_010463 [Morchella sextelata]|uniref:uncharacterized protein n=1 Tax=Morchella sextelata TaxID=1174677 RepID=UPI001D05BF7A|nr:uncharacterized protein H6S33_010463 [Morchella sextelata]KAH0612411.1 hypothetical protein H6S33_010463 [Morchella sextelata]
MASMTPPIFNVEDLANAAAGVASQRQPQTGETATTTQQPLRTSQSFRVDEGYSGLDDALREEYAYKLVRTLPTSNIASLVDRLVPILHLDFIQLLPSELSLQILSLWRDLYHGAGWEENSAEVRLFETEMQQQGAAKRKAEEQRDEEKKLRDLARRNIDRFRSGPGSQGESSASDSSGGPMDISGDSSTQGSSGAYGTPNQDAEYFPYTADSLRTIRQSSMAGVFGGPSAAMSDDDDMYPTGMSRPITSQAYEEPSLPIQPTLTMPGYNHPRLNWAFLYKNRRRLEDNWQHNRFTTFQIPHPNYPHEGHGECIYTIQYSPNFLVSGSRDRTVRIWNMRTRRLVGEPLKGHTGSVLCLQFDEEEQVLVTGSSDSSVIIWKFPTGEKLKVIEKAHQESVLNLKFSKKWLVTCSKDKLVKVWNREQLETTNKDYPWPSMGSGLNLQNPYSSSDPNRAFGASTRAPPKGSPRTLHPYTVIQNLSGHAAAVNAIQLHGDQIASASGDRLIKLWNLRTGACEKTFVGHTKGIACIQFDGRTIVSGSSDQTIRVFDCDTQAEMATLQGHGALVRTVQATRNRIVSGSYDETVRIWHKDQEDRWVFGATLHQSQSPAALRSAAAAGAGTPANVPAQIATLYQQQGMQPAAVHMHQIQQVGNQAGLAGAVAASQLLPAHHHHMPPRPIQPPQAVLPQGHGGNSGTHRVFKLQFDARWIICCSQDSKIIGWDYAADEESVMEASRFFKGG